MTLGPNKTKKSTHKHSHSELRSQIVDFMNFVLTKLKLFTMIATCFVIQFTRLFLLGTTNTTKRDHSKKYNKQCIPTTTLCSTTTILNTTNYPTTTMCPSTTSSSCPSTTVPTTYPTTTCGVSNQNNIICTLNTNFTNVLEKETGIFVLNVSKTDGTGPCKTFNIAKLERNGNPIINYLLKIDKEQCTIDLKWDTYIELKLSNNTYNGEYLVSWI